MDVLIHQTPVIPNGACLLVIANRTAGLPLTRPRNTAGPAFPQRGEAGLPVSPARLAPLGRGRPRPRSFVVLAPGEGLSCTARFWLKCVLSKSERKKLLRGGDDCGCRRFGIRHAEGAQHSKRHKRAPKRLHVNAGCF